MRYNRLEVVHFWPMILAFLLFPLGEEGKEELGACRLEVQRERAPLGCHDFRVVVGVKANWSRDCAKHGQGRAR